MGVGRRVRGEGKTPNRYMVIREHPGKDKARSGRPFSGRTGAEIERFLDGVRLPHLAGMYATSWIKEWCGPDLDYVAADYERDREELETEIRAVRPSLILALGRGVTRFFLGDVDLEETHGIPWKLPQDSPARKLFDSPEEVVIYVAINPAAGFRRPELSALSAYDFAQLEGVVNGTTVARVLYDDPIPNSSYRLLVGDEVCDVLSNYL